MFYKLLVVYHDRLMFSCVLRNQSRFPGPFKPGGSNAELPLKRWGEEDPQVLILVKKLQSMTICFVVKTWWSSTCRKWHKNCFCKLYFRLPRVTMASFLIPSHLLVTYYTHTYIYVFTYLFLTSTATSSEVIAEEGKYNNRIHNIYKKNPIILPFAQSGFVRRRLSGNIW